MRKFIFYFQAFIYALSYKLKRFRSKSPSSQTLRPKEIIIFRLDAVGDFFIWLHSAIDYRKFFPSQEYRITLVANNIWIDLAKKILDFDHYISVDRNLLSSDLHYFNNLIQEINDKKYSHVLHPTYSREFLADLLIFSTCSPQKIGHLGDFSTINSYLRELTNFFYHRLIITDNIFEMEIIHNAEFIRQAFDKNYKASLKNISTLINLVQEENLDKKIVFFPGASWDGKRWPIEKFKELILKIKTEYEEHNEMYPNTTNHSITICGGNNEVALSEELNINGTINLVGKTSLEELMNLIGQSHLLISNDTVAVHMAQAMQIPTICLLGGGHFGRFLPYCSEDTDTPITVHSIYHQMECYYCLWDCAFNLKKLKHAPCVSNIEVDQVFEEVKKYL